MLAGVTGVICPVAIADDEIATGPFTEEDDALISCWERDAGRPGGGIDKSTGDGESPGTSLFLCPPARDERRSGVEDADFVPRRARFVEFGVDGTRDVGDGRRRATFACSSSGGDAVRLLRRACWEGSGLYASIQGLRGERSKSKSPGDGRGIGGVVSKTTLAGAERASCEAGI